MESRAYLGLFVVLMTWSSICCQFPPFGAPPAGGMAGGMAAGPLGAFGAFNPFFAMPCNPHFGGRPQAPGQRQPLPGSPTAPAGSANVGGPPPVRGGLAGRPGQTPRRGFNMQAFMFSQAMDVPDAPDVPSMMLPGPNGQMMMTGCFCQEMSGIGFGSGECMSFLTGNWQRDTCTQYGMCCTCNDMMGGWKRR